jgi:L-asparagine transporter-like permease
LYSGWDTAAYVGEETKGKKAGSAAVTSVVILFVIYTVVIMAFQGVAPNKNMQNNAANILAYVGDLIGGGFWKQVMIVAVLGGTLASLQAAIVSTSRISFAMGRDRVFPRFLGQVNPKYHTPYDIASTLGLMAAIFYLLTASAAVWYYRRTIMSSTSNMFLGGFLPLLGAAFMLFVIIYSLASGDLDGIEIGFGFAVLGLIISFIVARTRHPRFYTDPRSSHGDHIEEELAAPEPEE